MGCCTSNTINLPISKNSKGRKCANSVDINKGKFVRTTKGLVKDHFDIIKTIGSGGFGTVFKAIDKRTGLDRAIKEIPKLKVDIVSEKQMLLEVELLKEIDHPNILKIYEVIESNLCYYIVSELLTGGELFDKVLKEMRFSENIAAKYTHDIVTALNYCHQKHIVHRDLKPENLLFASTSPNAPLKVIDFSISQRLVINSKLPSVIGTLCYIAPEVFSGAYDEKCDIWSAGIILYLMLCGRPPFIGTTEAEILTKARSANPDMTKGVWSSISEDAKDLIHKMICVNTTLRFSARDVLNHRWIKRHINNEIDESPINTQAFEQLSKFRAQSKLEKSILTFIASQVASPSEEADLIHLFKQLDKNGDGRLSMTELSEGSAALGLGSQLDVVEIMKNCDTDENGYLDYTEFLTATTEWNKVIQKEQLQQAFKLYDKGGDGQLSLSELKECIPGIEDSEWNKFLEEADTDRNGVISLEEFKQYLTLKILQI
ncbi:unnamed protein product [Blepharisma stoltei]|uniref:non-specific serine/threonine protein kinase n=1 Tax=Blepharisma stoltei TaxID=1481888 RepID=A0AAU9K8V1_9CILI|nr:unnamed protein product [Blepharisma stoltei]